jgi:ankyrin repeat protein
MVGSGRRVTTAVIIATALAMAAAPAVAQFSSAAYDFLKAVKDRDGTKVQDLLNKASSTIVLTRDDATGETALHIVVKRRDLVWTQYMLAKGVPIDGRDRDGNTALFDAAQLGFADGEQLLLQVGATVDLANNRGETPLIAATQAHDIGSVRLLLQAGADPKETDHVAGMSAIDYATRDNRSAQILTLLKSVKPVVHKNVAGPSIN